MTLEQDHVILMHQVEIQFMKFIYIIYMTMCHKSVSL